MLLAMEEEPPLAAKCKDKFMVQSITITPEKKNLPLSDIVSNQTPPFLTLRHYFSNTRISFVGSRNVSVYIMMT